MPSFNDLKIYQESIRLIAEVDKLCKTLPYQEKFQLRDQAARSSSSVPDNIAEGYNAYHYKDKINRFYDARKESGETQNHILKMEAKGYISKEVFRKLFDNYQQLIRGINGYINYSDASPPRFLADWDRSADPPNGASELRKNRCHGRQVMERHLKRKRGDKRD